MTPLRPGDFPPAPEDELALLLVGTADRRSRWAARIGELSGRVDESRLTAGLLRQRIFVLAGGRLADMPLATVSAAFRSRVQAALSAAHVRAMAFATASGHLSASLEQAGIPAVTLKGGALAAELYGDGALREYEDIDVLVELGQLAGAVAVAGSLGWRIGETGGPLPTLHRALRHPRGMPPVELHWRIHWYETSFSAELVRRSRMIDGLRRLDPFDELAALLLFYARDGFAGLRLAADIAAWWDKYGSSEAIAALEDRIERHPRLSRPWCTALAMAVGVAGLPDAALTPRTRTRGRRAILAARLANWDLRGDPDQIIANVTLVDGLLAPPGGLPAFARRRLTAHEAPAQNVVKTIMRYALALPQLQRGRSWSPLPAVARAAAPTMPRSSCRPVRS
jgi:hypothetical protein